MVSRIGSSLRYSDEACSLRREFDLRHTKVSMAGGNGGTPLDAII